MLRPANGLRWLPGGDRVGALTPPVVDFDWVFLSQCSAIAGHVYRGCRMPELDGRFFYSDWCAGVLWPFVLDGGVATDPREWDPDIGGPVSFGEDADGEMYFLTGDAIFRIVPN